MSGVKPASGSAGTGTGSQVQGQWQHLEGKELLLMLGHWGIPGAAAASAPCQGNSSSLLEINPRVTFLHPYILWWKLEGTSHTCVCC